MFGTSLKKDAYIFLTQFLLLNKPKKGTHLVNAASFQLSGFSFIYDLDVIYFLGQFLDT